LGIPTQLNSDLANANVLKVINGNISDFADSCPIGLTIVSTGDSTVPYNGMGSRYTIGMVLKRTGSSCVVVMFSYSRKEIYILNKNDTWDSSVTIIK